MTALWEHEKLLVYTKALEAVDALESVAAKVPGHRGDIKDQIVRAAASIPLNIAEGAGEYRKAEKCRFYRMARRSAAECAAALDVVTRIPGSRIDTSKAKAAAAEVSALLTLLIRSTERRQQ